MEIIKKGTTQSPWLYGTCTICGCVVRCKYGDAAIIPPELGGATPKVECPTANCGATIALNDTSKAKTLAEEFEDFFCEPTDPPRKKRVMMVGDERSQWPPSRVAQALRARLVRTQNELSKLADEL